MVTPVKKIDFSEYHPLDHRLFSVACYEYYGGARRHIYLAWTFKWYPKIWSKTLCLMGIHRVRPVSDRMQDEDFEMCICCYERVENDGY